MRSCDRASPRRVALWRHTSALLVASLLSLLASQPFHERAAGAAASGAPAAVASGAGAGADAPQQAAGHDRDHCVQCRAVAQTRLGLRAPAHDGALASQGPALALAVAPPDGPVAAPEPCVAGPRAPPVRLSVLHS